MFRERTILEQIHWSPGHGTKFELIRKISDITPGSSVDLQTDKRDVVKVAVTRNDAGNFTGSVVDIRPDPPRSKRIADLQVGDEVRFGEKNLISVVPVPKPSIG